MKKLLPRVQASWTITIKPWMRLLVISSLEQRRCDLHPVNTCCSHYSFKVVVRPPEIEHNDVEMAASTTWCLQPALSPRAASNLPCRPISPAIISSSLNVLFMLAELVSSAKVNALSVYTRRSSRHSLEVNNHASSQRLELRKQATTSGPDSVMWRLTWPGLYYVYYEAARSALGNSLHCWFSDMTYIRLRNL